MKKLIFLFIIFLALICCKTQHDVVRKIDKEHQFAPPGTIWIRDSIFMDRQEIRNLDYYEYVTWVKQYDNSNYSKVFPDTTVWLDKSSYNAPYVTYYFTHPAYRNYPVVGVSYEQAVAFCKWRTERVKEFIKLKKHNNTIEKTVGAKDFYYRLPTKEEWEYAASAGTQEAFGFESIHEKDNTPKINVKETTLLYYNSNDVLVPVNYKSPNKFGLYNAIGNVAEMISDKGISKGGSWRNSINECTIHDSIKYDKPTAWLGFRCVCVMKK